MNSIYTITVFAKDPIKQHTWTWYPTAEEAVETVKRCHAGMLGAGYYYWLYVERVDAGLNCYTEPVAWFTAEYDETRGSYTLAEFMGTPTWAVDVCNFSMG